MKRLGEGTSAHIVSSVKRSILSSLSFTKRPATRTPISKRLFRSIALPISIALGVLLVGLTLFPMPGMFTRGGSATAATESISTFTSNCTTASSSFNLGDTVCAVVTGAPFPNQRRFQWVAPDGSIAQQNPISSDPASDTFTIPTTGNFAQVGTWLARTITNRSSGFASTQFVVQDPASANVDLSVAKYGPPQTAPGNNINYRIEVTNNGPNDAQVVTLTDPVPANTTFVSEAQNSGPGFTCTAPNAGATGTISCTIASLPAGSTAVFTFAVNVNGGTSDGTTITNTASVSSDTNELNTANNTSTAETTITAVSTVCTLNCGSDVTQDNDPNQCSAVVTYAMPTTSGACGSPPDNEVSCNPPSGSTFPIGATTVSCSTQSGGGCSFTVTVHDTRPPVQPTIVSCPSSVSVGEDTPDSGSAVVNYSAPTTTGNCVTTVCDPASGSSFSVGTTTVSCTATDSANNSVSCSFTVTVTSGAACTLTCPGDVTQTAASGQCNAVVDYSAPATSGNCGTVTCSPPSGSTFQAGSTTVTCTSSEGPTCEFIVTVNASAAPTITSCASNRTITVDANCEAAIPNMVGEVVTTGCSVTVTQSPAAGTVATPGTVTVTLTAENSTGEATCTVTVTVADTTAPTITTCPAATSASADANCQAPVPDVTTSVTAADNCTPSASLTVTQSPASGTLVGVGPTTITITVKDASNNSATCTTTFTVNDTTPPTAVCKNITVALDANGNASITGADVDNGSSDNCGIASRTVSPNTFTCANKGPNTVTLTVKDASNNTVTCQATVTVVDNTPPTITCPANVITNADPGVCTAVVTFAPTVSDNCTGATFVCSPPSLSAFPLGTTGVACTATDASANSAGCTFTVTVNNPNPVVTITGPPSGALYSVNTAVNFTATFTDAGGGTHTGTWAFQSNILSLTQAATIVEPSGSTPGSANTTFTFTSDGVYLVTLTVNDSCGGTGSANTVDVLTALVVVYDPNGGFVTGGGWINSPAGAYTPNSSLTGKASFGFVSKYQNGAGVPTGNTEFQFRVANFNFRSTVYEWLVISGARAQYEGSGTVNGAGDYRFMLTVIDGQVNGGGGVDKFRIRIWNNNGGGIVYDNQMNDPDTADATTVLGGGSIVIHKDN